MAGGISRKKERKVSPHGPGGELAAGGLGDQERPCPSVWSLVLRWQQQPCLCRAHFHDARHEHQQHHAALRAGSTDLQVNSNWGLL